MKKCVVLFSGGLDSLLAVKIMKEMEFDVLALHLDTSFEAKQEVPGIRYLKEWNVTFFREKIPFEEYKKILIEPRYGYGKNMNPCIDCKILMLKIAKAFMLKYNATCIVTGEVIGQRPMSQRKRIMELIEKEADVEGYVVRPLSGKLLPPTVVEKKGFLCREKFFAIKGRGRKVQFELAKKWNITDYSSPAGGCLLTDPGFSKRLKKLISINKEFTERDIEILKTGRHFIISEKDRLIVARNHQESEVLKKLVKEEVLIVPLIKGPTAIFEGKEDRLKDALKIVASYCTKDPDKEVNFIVKNGEERKERVKPFKKEVIEQWLL